jgi:hypothetical protein
MKARVFSSVTLPILTMAVGFFAFPNYLQWRVTACGRDYETFRVTNSSVEIALNRCLYHIVEKSGKHQESNEDRDARIEWMNWMRSREKEGKLYYCELRLPNDEIKTGYVVLNRFGMKTDEFWDMQIK